MSAKGVILGAEKAALVNIQYLRAIAAMMVVWVHAREQFSWLKLQFPSSAGGNGVDLFFVISGFIMVYTTHGKNITTSSFIKRRLERVVPLYWLATFLILVVGLIAPSVLRSTLISLPHVIASFLFWPMPSPKFPAEMWPLLVPGWTLNYEMAFYVLFGLTLLAPKGWRLLLLCGSLIFAVLLGYVFDLTGVLGFYTDGIVLTFGAGALLANLYCNGRFPRSTALGWILIVSGVALWWGMQSMQTGHRVIGAGIPAIVIVTGSCVLPSIGSKWLSWLRVLGDASYSIYISHIFSLSVLRVFWSAFDIHYLNGLVIILTSLVVCAVLGVFVYRYIEMPINKWASVR